MQQINTREFNYHDGTFTACASTLEEYALYCSTGFELVSERTGKVIQMRLVQPHYDREGDITHWEFIPTDRETFKSLIIFND